MAVIFHESFKFRKRDAVSSATPHVVFVVPRSIPMNLITSELLPPAPFR